MTYTTFFATHLTVPTIRPATDQEMFGGQWIEPIKDFGIGEPCLIELIQGERKSVNNFAIIIIITIKLQVFMCAEAVSLHVMLQSKHDF